MSIQLIYLMSRDGQQSLTATELRSSVNIESPAESRVSSDP